MLDDTTRARLSAIATAVDGEIDYDEIAVYVDYGSRLGCLTIRPDGDITTASGEMPGARVSGTLSRRSGYRHSELRSTLRAAGIYAR